MSVTEKGSNTDPKHDFMDDYEPIDMIIKDSYSRHSRAWRLRSGDNDKLFSVTVLTEPRTTYVPERNMFRPLDRVVCFMISTFSAKKDGRVLNLLGTLCLPFVMIYLGYLMLMVVWDRWRAGPPPETE